MLQISEILFQKESKESDGIFEIYISFVEMESSRVID
jgi:hypothetical protein